MTVLLSHRMLLAGWARRATPTAAQWIHHNPEKMTLLEMLGTTNLRKSTPRTTESCARSSTPSNDTPESATTFN